MRFNFFKKKADALREAFEADRFEFAPVNIDKDVTLDMSTDIDTSSFDFSNVTFGPSGSTGVSAGFSGFASGSGVSSVSGSVSAGVSSSGTTFSSVSASAFGDRTFISTFEDFF